MGGCGRTGGVSSASGTPNTWWLAGCALACSSKAPEAASSAAGAPEIRCSTCCWVGAVRPARKVVARLRRTVAEPSDAGAVVKGPTGSASGATLGRVGSSFGSEAAQGSNTPQPSSSSTSSLAVAGCSSPGTGAGGFASSAVGSAFETCMGDISAAGASMVSCGAGLSVAGAGGPGGCLGAAAGGGGEGGATRATGPGLGRPPRDDMRTCTPVSKVPVAPSAGMALLPSREEGT
jgi:hypothetical protein